MCSREGLGVRLVFLDQLVSLRSLERSTASVSFSMRRVSFLELFVLDVQTVILNHLFFCPDLEGLFLLTFFPHLRPLERYSEGLGKTRWLQFSQDILVELFLSLCSVQVRFQFEAITSSCHWL